MNLTGINESTDGLIYLDYRNETRFYNQNQQLKAWTTPYYPDKAIIIMWLTDKRLMADVLNHELRHLKCWRKEGRKGYIDNFINHKGCFLN